MFQTPGALLPPDLALTLVLVTLSAVLTWAVGFPCWLWRKGSPCHPLGECEVNSICQSAQGYRCGPLMVTAHPAHHASLSSEIKHAFAASGQPKSSRSGAFFPNRFSK